MNDAEFSEVLADFVDMHNLIFNEGLEACIRHRHIKAFFKRECEARGIEFPNLPHWPNENDL